MDSPATEDKETDWYLGHGHHAWLPYAVIAMQSLLCNHCYAILQASCVSLLERAMIIHVLSLFRFMTRDEHRRDGQPGLKGNARTVAGQVATSAIARHAATPLPDREGRIATGKTTTTTTTTTTTATTTTTTTTMMTFTSMHDGQGPVLGTG